MQIQLILTASVEVHEEPATDDDDYQTPIATLIQAQVMGESMEAQAMELFDKVGIAIQTNDQRIYPEPQAPMPTPGAYGFTRTDLGDDEGTPVGGYV